jgi:hypothetical protein
MRKAELEEKIWPALNAETAVVVQQLLRSRGFDACLFDQSRAQLHPESGQNEFKLCEKMMRRES